MKQPDNKPLVSIIITSFNRAVWIEKAIQSALAQDYPNLEIIISDNNSTDNSDEIIKKYTPDKRIKYFRNEVNIGMVANFKIATAQRASGTFVNYISSDDYLSNNYFISEAVDLINKYPNVVLVTAKYSTLTEGSDELVADTTDMFQEEFREGKEAFELFPALLSPGWGGILLNRDKLIKTDAFESKAQSLDYEANLKLMLQGNLAYISKSSYVFRRHASQISSFMTYQAHINNLDFIENTYHFAKKLNVAIDLEAWRQKVYIAYLHGSARKLINKNNELKNLVNYVKKEKKIKFSFFKDPQFMIMFMTYKNYNTFRPILKLFYPKKFHSIEKELN